MQTITNTENKPVKADMTYCESMVEKLIPEVDKEKKAEITLTLFHFIGLMDVSERLDYIATRLIIQMTPNNDRDTITLSN